MHTQRHTHTHRRTEHTHTHAHPSDSWLCCPITLPCCKALRPPSWVAILARHIRARRCIVSHTGTWTNCVQIVLKFAQSLLILYPFSVCQVNGTSHSTTEGKQPTLSLCAAYTNALSTQVPITISSLPSCCPIISCTISHHHTF